MKDLEPIKRNWKHLPKFLKSQIVRKLHEKFSIRQIAKLLHIPKSNVFYYTQERKYAIYNTTSTSEINMAILKDFIHTLIHADLVINEESKDKSPPLTRDEALIKHCVR